MDTPNSIRKRQPDPAGLDFDGLKKAGIELLQDLCGRTWTDYNLHDPGLTILEQLCYALTELNYRAGFPMADLLAGEDGRIDYEGQALYRPQDILPSQPVTLDDYRKLIIDQVPDIDNVWFRTERKPGTRAAGLYWVYVRLREPVSESVRSETDQVLQRVREVYAAHRNLCEDLQEVRIVPQRRHGLQGRVVLDGTRPPVEVLAELYFRCARRVAQGIDSLPYEERRAQGATLVQLFEGPLTEHGHIDGKQLAQSADTVSIVDLIGIIGRIAGVRHVDQLSFRDEQGQTTDSLAVGDFLDALPFLVYPASDAEIGVGLYKSGRQPPVTCQALRFELDRLHAEHLPSKRGAADLEALCALPVGLPRSMASYHSIQHHFPDIYGINTNGVPESAPAARKAQARQLKAYLLFFEQILANAQEQVRRAGGLFSLDEDLRQSYFSRWLDEDSVPGIDALYAVPRQDREALVAAVLAGHDAYGERRHRVLDHLLGLYGEGFSQKSLRQFSAYLEEGDEAEALLRNKLRFLGSMVALSGRRAGAFDYLQGADCEANHATLVSKLAILLGMDVPCTRLPSKALRDKGLELVEDAVGPAGGDEAVVAEAEGCEQLQHILPGSAAGLDDARLFERVAFLKAKRVDGAMLRGGIDLDNYRIQPARGGPSRRLLMRAAPGVPWRAVAQCGSADEATQTAWALRDLLVGLNARSEGMLLVEHLLLRPRGGKPFGIQVTAEFFAFRLSLVLPAWTARCSDPEFRHLAAESVALNCPAHICPAILWLDFAAMETFEGLYGAWLAAMRLPGSDHRAIDTASERLLAFLLEHGGGA